MPFRRVMCALVIAAVSLAGAAIARADTPAPVFRIFLKDGTALACWGEYARVGDHLVLTIPIGAGARRTFEFVSVPVQTVDLEKTERYAEAVRAAQFASARGAKEYAELSDRLSKQLAALPLLPNATERLAAAEGARQQLIDWASTSHGYKAKDVQQMLHLFDSTIIDLRVAAGESRFAISLMGGVVPPPPPRLRAAPGPAETIALALKAAAMTDDEEVRKAVLKRARAAAATLPQGETGDKLRATVADRLAAEARTDATYRWLGNDVKRLAAKAVDAGDTRAVDALRQRVTASDRRYGQKRPAEIQGLLGALDAFYQAAAEQRLVLDQWEAGRAELDAYAARVAPIVARLNGLRPILSAIKDLAGTPVTDLVRAEEDTAGMVAAFGGISAPEGGAAAHALVAQAIERADFAVRTRHRAVSMRDLPAARDAAAAAAEARARLDEAKAALAAMTRPPKASR